MYLAAELKLLSQKQVDYEDKSVGVNQQAISRLDWNTDKWLIPNDYSPKCNTLMHCEMNYETTIAWH